jgi:hypothetical protein
MKEMGKKSMVMNDGEVWEKIGNGEQLWDL